VASYPVGTSPYGIAIDPSGQFLYVSNSADNTVSGFKVDPTAGTLTTMGAAVATGATGVETTATGIVVDPSSQYLYVTNGDSATTNASSISLMKITAVTGVPVPVGTPVPSSNTCSGATFTFGCGTTTIAIK
jgi:DNA-binding beta-propeller fold protein YncE